MKTLYRDNKGLHRWLFACGAVLVLFYLFRGNRAAVNFWVYSVTLPFEQFLGRACAALPFSVAELLYVLAAVTAVVDALPVFGTGTILVPWAVYELLLGSGVRAVSLVLIWMGTNLVRSTVQAKLLGDRIGLSPLASLLAVYVGWRAWRVWGMLLFPIVLAVLSQLNDKGIIRLWRNV